MSEEDVSKFYSWARSFAISQTKLPNRNALEKILKSTQQRLFLSILDKVRPKDQVRMIKKSILIDKLNGNSNCVVQVSVSRRNLSLN